VQVDPIKLKLRPPGTKRLKPKCRTLLSTSAFKFKLRLYIEGGSGMPNADMVVVDSQAGPLTPPSHPPHTPPTPPSHPPHTPPTPTWSSSTARLGPGPALCAHTVPHSMPIV